MEIIAIALVLGILILIAAVWLRRKKAAFSRANWPFYAKKPLTKPEQILYYRLIKALPECVVLAQVQLSRVLGVKRGHNFAVWNNRINRLSLDYVICLKDLTVVAAIELDDSSHNRDDRRYADERKAWALESAGVPLIRWSVSALPSEHEIREAIAK